MGIWWASGAAAVWDLAVTAAARRPLAAALPPLQLYHLGNDPAEQENLQARELKQVQMLTELLEKLVAEGRSTPGPRQENNGQIDIRCGMRRGK